jgi:periplasmic protein TonB
MLLKIARVAASALVLTLAGWGQNQPKKLSKSEATEAAVSKPSPVYPAIARQLKIQGEVELEAVIATDGTVEEVHVVSGNPILTKPAAETVKKWKFNPIKDGDKPVKALAPISIAFKL